MFHGSPQSLETGLIQVPRVRGFHERTEPAEQPCFVVVRTAKRAPVMDVTLDNAAERADGYGLAHERLPASAVPAGMGRATSRKASVCRRMYTEVLSRLVCPSRSPIALMPTPCSSSRMANPWRRPYGEALHSGSPLFFTRRWKIALMDGAVIGPVGARTVRKSSLRLVRGRPRRR